MLIYSPVRTDGNPTFYHLHYHKIILQFQLEETETNIVVLPFPSSCRLILKYFSNRQRGMVHFNLSRQTIIVFS